MNKTIVSIVKSVQIRTEVFDEQGKITHGWNKRYMKPTLAAREWASGRNRIWEHRQFHKGNGAYYHNMTEQDWEYSWKREERLYRRALPIFRALLA